MIGLLTEAGYVINDNPHYAQTIIVNTCGFIEDASSESIQTILDMTNYKKNGTCKALIITGCMAQRYKDEIFKSLPEADAVIGVNEYPRIVDVVTALLKEDGDAEIAFGTQQRIIHAQTDTEVPEQVFAKRVLSTPGHYAYLKIAEGCDNRCTYCTIPSIRGAYRSRSMDSLLAEAEALVRGGVKELVLVAQDTALYGVDGDKGSAEKIPQLHKLLAELGKMDGLEWIRILYAYPEHIYPELIAEMARNDKVCKYLDMPIQHSSTSVLKRMGRRSTEETLRRVIADLRAEMPDICLRTTLITGFPGETDAEHQELMDFVRDMRFDKLGVFKYSREEGTPAARMEQQVPAAIKNKRYKQLMTLQKDISSEIHNSLIGKTLRCIVDGRVADENHDTGYVYCARSYRDCYEIDGLVFFHSDEEIMTGEIVELRITNAQDYDNYGVMV